MQFHGTWCGLISITRSDRQNSMDLLMSPKNGKYKVPGSIWNLEEVAKRFNAIPWNLEWANFDDNISFMEFHGTWSAPISIT